MWDDTKIKAGDIWRDEIKQALASAKVAVLLVTTNFLNSDFIAEHELPPLLEAAQKEGLRILLVVVGHSLFEETELGHYQAVNDPLRPLASVTAANRDKEIVRICREIKAAVASPTTQAVAGAKSSGTSYTRLSNKELKHTASKFIDKMQAFTERVQMNNPLLAHLYDEERSRELVGAKTDAERTEIIRRRFIKEGKEELEYSESVNTEYQRDYRPIATILRDEFLRRFPEEPSPLPARDTPFYESLSGPRPLENILNQLRQFVELLPD